MVIITINGKKKDREFQNMAQALAFAYQNGECYNAEKLEIAYAAREAAKPAPAGPGKKPDTVKNETGGSGAAQGGGGDGANPAV